MVNANTFFGKYFKNKSENNIVCTCCGRKIRKGYTVYSANLGEDCYESIRAILNYDIDKLQVKKCQFFSVQAMHFEWIDRVKNSI